MNKFLLIFPLIFLANFSYAKEQLNNLNDKPKKQLYNLIQVVPDKKPKNKIYDDLIEFNPDKHQQQINQNYCYDTPTMAPRLECNYAPRRDQEKQSYLDGYAAGFEAGRKTQ